MCRCLDGVAMNCIGKRIQPQKPIELIDDSCVSDMFSILLLICSLPSGNMGLFDPTEIHNRGMIKKHMRNCMIYLGYFLIFFFIYLYWWVVYQLHFLQISIHLNDSIHLIHFMIFSQFNQRTSEGWSHTAAWRWGIHHWILIKLILI